MQDFISVDGKKIVTKVIKEMKEMNQFEREIMINWNKRTF
jgi:hypothetical protein